MTNIPLESLVGQLAGKHVLVVGDIMLDEFVMGEVHRISPEAPVPVVHAKSRSLVPGGASNVAANIAKLGGKVELCGVVGDDANGNSLKELLDENEIGTSGLLVDQSRSTTTKCRIVGHSQQIVRIDWEDNHPFVGQQLHLLQHQLQAKIAWADVVVISDYNKGVITSELTSWLFETCREHKKPTVVDPKGTDVSKYVGATLMTPNLNEVAAFTGCRPTDEASLIQAAALLQTKLPGTSVLITRGSQGMSLFSPDEPALHIPTFAQRVFDVTGAGDTVVSTLSLCMAAGANLRQSCVVANAAAGVVVGKLGTSTVTTNEIMEFWQLHSKDLHS